MANGLRRIFSWSLLGQGSYAATQWVALSVLAKLGSQAEAETRLGNFVLALAITAPIVLFANMELRVLAATDAEAKHHPRHYFVLRAICMAAMVVIAAAVPIIVGKPMAVVWIVALVAALRFVEGFSDLAYGFFQREDQHARMAISQVTRGVIGVGCLSAVLWSRDSLVLGLTAQLAVWLGVFLLVDVRNLRLTSFVRAPPPTTKGSTLRGLALRALPLGVAASLVSFNTNIPRYIIDMDSGTRLLGIFGSMAYLLTVITLVNQALRSATAPRIARHFSSGNLRQVKRLGGLTLGVAAVPGLALAALAIVAGGPILSILYRPEFAPHANALAVLALAGVFGGVSGSLRSILTAGNVLVAQVPVLLVTGGVTLAVGLWAVPRDPLIGGAWAVVAGRVVLVLLYGALTIRLLGRTRETIDAPSEE